MFVRGSHAFAMFCAGVLMVNIPSKLRPGDVNGLTSYVWGTHFDIEYCLVGRDSPLNCVLQCRMSSPMHALQTSAVFHSDLSADLCDQISCQIFTKFDVITVILL